MDLSPVVIVRRVRSRNQRMKVGYGNDVSKDVISKMLQQRYPAKEKYLKAET